jgi:hypothetical protein
MKIRKGIAVASAVAVVPLMMAVSASPASAMPKSCLTMHVAYEQASLTSSHANATMTSFQDNVTWYADSGGFYREKGWYFGFDGSMQWYDLDPATWNDWDSFNVMDAANAEANAQAAYDELVSNCAW